jgi:hypothetical protein
MRSALLHPRCRRPQEGAMDELRGAVIHWNIERYERQLEIETDATKRRMLRGLLTEARNEAMLLSAEGALEQAGKECAALVQEARRWRVRAEEYRVISDACQSDAARSAYVNLARGYELLAERAEAFAAGEIKPKPKAG